MSNRSKVLNAIASLCLVVIPAKALSQSANTPLSYISEEDFLNAMSLFRPALEVEKKGSVYELVLPNGLSADAQLAKLSRTAQHSKIAARSPSL